jgi:hypothetical protein
VSMQKRHAALNQASQRLETPARSRTGQHTAALRRRGCGFQMDVADSGKGSRLWSTQYGQHSASLRVSPQVRALLCRP